MTCKEVQRAWRQEVVNMKDPGIGKFNREYSIQQFLMLIPLLSCLPSTGDSGKPEVYTVSI